MPIADYTAHLTLAGYRARTIRERHRCLHAFAATIHPRSLYDATRRDLEHWLSRPLAPESRRAYRSHLRAFYQWMVDEDHIPTNPTAKIPAIRVPRATPRPIPDRDLILALDQARPRMRAWMLLMSLAGLRCLEVAHLRPPDLLTTEHGNLLYLRECKGGGSGTVPAHPLVVTALQALPVRDSLWWDCNAATVSKQVAAHLRGLGIRATAHQMRHFAGTAWYRESGHDLLTTAELLRHRKVTSTQIYALLDPTRPAEVVARMVLPT